MRCDKCGDELTGKPKISVERRVYCYRCAKIEVSSLEFARANIALSEYEEKRMVYEQRKSEFQARHNEWYRKRNEYCDLGSQGCLGGIVLAVALGYLAATISLNAAWLGVVAAVFLYIMISSYIEGKRTEKFLLHNPEPLFSLSEPQYYAPAKVNHNRLEHDGTMLLNWNYREEILKRDKNTCQSCGQRKHRKNLEVHHIIPRSKGGSDKPTNLITLCKHCHDREDWYGHHRAFPTTLKRRRRRFW